MNLHFMSSFTGCEQDISIIEEYDKKNRYTLCFWSIIVNYNPMENYEIKSVGQKVDEDYNMKLHKWTNQKTS
jgi:hypothetical protein